MSQTPLPPKPAPDVDFPIERAEAAHVTRREFAKFLCLVSAGMVVGSGWVATKDRLFPRKRLEGEHEVCGTGDVPVGGTHGFQLPGSQVPYILIHRNDGTWGAFGQRCTHLACAVYYQPRLDRIECPCHNGYFDARTGGVLQGPPPRRLPVLDVQVRDGRIFVSEPAARA